MSTELSVYTSSGPKSIGEIISEIQRAVSHGMIPFFVIYQISPQALERAAFVEHHATQAAKDTMARAIDQYKKDHEL